jgi:hypothetical protein
MGKQLLDLGLALPLALKDLRLSGMALGAFSHHIQTDLSLPALKELIIHNCSKEMSFLRHFTDLPGNHAIQFQLKVVEIYDTRTERNRFDPNAFVSGLFSFLQSFGGSYHLRVDIAPIMMGDGRN